MENEIDIKPILKWGLLLFIVMIGISVYAWLTLPNDAQVAIHWGLQGTPDGWAGKTSALITMPIVFLAILGIYALYIRFMPRKANIADSQKAINVIVVLTLGIMVCVQLMIVLYAVGVKISVPLTTQIMVGVLFMVIGNFMGKIRSNFMAGVRTPWTLSSELSWEKTNRLGGKLFFTMGIIMILGSFMNDMLMWVGLMITQVVISTIILAVYSYKIWQIDPAKTGESFDDDQYKQWQKTHLLREGIITKSSILLLIAVLLIFWTAIAANKPAPELEAKAVQLVQNLAAGKYQEAELHFDDTMKSKLPPQELQKAWEQVEADKGKFVRQLDVKSSSLWPYKMILVECEFEQQTMFVKVVFSTTGQVSGLWISPK